MVHLPPRNSRSPVRVHLRSLGARRIGAFRRRRRRVIPARPTTASSESRVRRLATLLTLILIAAACRASAAEHKLFAWRVAGDPGTVYLLGSIHVGKPDLYPLPQQIEQAFAVSAELVKEIDSSGLLAVDPDAERIQRIVRAAAVRVAGRSAGQAGVFRTGRRRQFGRRRRRARAGLAHRRYGRDGGDRHPRRARAPRNAAADRSPRIPAKLGRSRTS